MSEAERPKKKRPKDPQIAEVDDLIVRAVGQELRRVRKSKDWTRQYLVSRVGDHLPLNTYACYELGTRPCPIARLVEICRALGVAPGEILDKAMERIGETDLRTSGLSVDLHSLMRADLDQFEILRPWAEDYLKRDTGDSGVIQLSWELIEELAVLFDLPDQELVAILKEFAPETAVD